MGKSIHFKFERLGYCIRAMSKDEISILKISTQQYVLVKIQYVRGARRHVRKHDFKNLYWYNDVNSEYVVSALPYFDSENFVALCEHYLGNKNFYDRDGK